MQRCRGADHVQICRGATAEVQRFSRGDCAAGVCTGCRCKAGAKEVHRWYIGAGGAEVQKCRVREEVQRFRGRDEVQRCRKVKMQRCRCSIELLLRY